MTTHARTKSSTWYLTLAALLLAVGVICLRGLSLLSAPPPGVAGSQIERDLVYLLEPSLGAGNVRLSVTGKADKTVLVLINGAAGDVAAPVRNEIEAVLGDVIGFDAASDTLSLRQFPFEKHVSAELSPLEMGEILGLGLLCVVLIGLLVQGRSDRAMAAMLPTGTRSESDRVSPPTHMTSVQPEADGVADAARAAESSPQETVLILRQWMREAEDAA